MNFTQVLESIKKSDNKDLFVIDFYGYEVTFRLPSVTQAFQIANLASIAGGNESLKYIISKYVFDTYVSNDCVIKHQKTIPAGIEESVTSVILFLSGTLDNSVEYTNMLLDTYRDNINNTISAMKRVICSTFQGYTFADLEVLNYQKLVEVFVNAEQLLIERDIIKDRFSFSTKEEAKQQNISDMIREDNKQLNEIDKLPAVKDPRVAEMYRRRQERMNMIHRGG